MLVGGRCMFVPDSTMFVSSLGMLFRLFVLAEIMMVGRLVMMVGGRRLEPDGAASLARAAKGRLGSRLKATALSWMVERSAGPQAAPAASPFR
jgi:hypothetical protein